MNNKVKFLVFFGGVCVFLSLYLCVYVCVCMYMCMSVCLCDCVCGYVVIVCVGMLIDQIQGLSGLGLGLGRSS